MHASNRADEILELVTTNYNFGSPAWQTRILNMLGECEDEEIVEIMRASAATLAYRSVTHEDEDELVNPTGEVYITAYSRITSAFAKHVKDNT